MNKDKLILNLLGLATRARMVTLGEEFVMKELGRVSQAVLFLASDAGENIKKKIDNKTKTYNTTLVTSFTTDQLSKAIGKENRKIILVSDKGFYKKFLEYINS